MSICCDQCVQPQRSGCPIQCGVFTKGYDAVHLYEQKLHRLSDGDVLRKALFENRILLTMDLDFARLIVEMDATDLQTVILFRLTDQRPQNVQARIEALLPTLGQHSRQGHFILSVSDDQVRIRTLPIRRT